MYNRNTFFENGFEEIQVRVSASIFSLLFNIRFNFFLYDDGGIDICFYYQTVIFKYYYVMVRTALFLSQKLVNDNHILFMNYEL